MLPNLDQPGLAAWICEPPKRRLKQKRTRIYSQTRAPCISPFWNCGTWEVFALYNLGINGID